MGITARGELRQAPGHVIDHPADDPGTCRRQATGNLEQPARTAGTGEKSCPTLRERRHDNA